MQPVFVILSIRSMRKEAGFTIVELVVTIVVTGLVVLAVTSLFITISGTQRSTRYLETATRAGEAEIESLRNNYYGSLESGSTIDFTEDLPSTLVAPRSGEAVISEPSPNMKRVDITITYRDGSRNKTVQLSSILGQLGIGQ